MRLIIFFTFFISSYSIFSQEISGKFDVGHQGGEYIYLFEREAKRQSKLDSAKIAADGSFNFGSKKYPEGLYHLQWKTKKNNIELILSPSESVVKLSFPNGNLNKYVVIESAENSVYKEYLGRKLIRDRQLRKYHNSKKVSGLDAVGLTELNVKIDRSKKAFFENVSVLINDNPESFFTKLILASDADRKDAKQYYFSDLDFNDESFIRSDVFAKRFQEYIILFSKGDADGYLNCIDDILERAKVNQRVYEFSAYNLLEGFYNTGLIDVSNYIMDEYIFGDDCGGWEVSEILKSRGNRIKSIQLNNMPPEIVMSSADGSYKKLSAVAGKNKYTLVLFWASWCHKCENQMADIVKTYEQYNNQGFEVFAVSLDEHRNSWKKAISEKGMKWVNVCDFNSWESKMVRNYSVSKTPTFFLVDSDRKIVAKPRNSIELNKVLAGLRKVGAL